jgi:glycerol-3-phosphate dehydrogenase subunit B
MGYDCIVIGGGLSGLTCGIKLASEGVRVAVISSGMNALHFSSGSIDVFGYTQSGSKIRKPFDHIESLAGASPEHPYSRIGAKAVRDSMDFFREEVAKAGLVMNHERDENHVRATGMGVMKVTFLSQEGVYNQKLKEAVARREKIAVLNFYGYRDYYAALTVQQLKKYPALKDTEIVTGEISLPFYTGTQKNLHEFRSIDLARVFDTEKYLPRIAGEIVKKAQGARIVSLPAFIGIENFSRIHTRLEELTGSLIYEIPTLPPSILGLRLDNALRSRFAFYGGEYSAADKVIAGTVENGRLAHIRTENYEGTMHKAAFFVMSTGSFFSGGLRSTFNSLDEPIFGLKINAPQSRREWYSQKFFDKKSHPFLSYGVETDGELHPTLQDGNCIENLFCTGAILSDYDPVQEGSGGGVAVSTGYFAAMKIIERIRAGIR